MVKKEETTTKSSSDTVSVNVKFPKALLDKIDKYHDENHLNTRTSAIFELIRVGLGELERPKK